jgi:nicotinamidase-related amidase
VSRHPELLDRRRTGLLVVDIQEKIAAVMLHRQQVIDNAQKMIRACQLLKVPIFITEQYPQGLGTTESDLIEALGGVTPLTKLTFSCCGIEGLAGQLRARNVVQIVLVGIEAHVCVLQTALDLLSLGFQVHVLKDCISSRKEIDFETALQRMQTAGVIVSTVEAALFELLERAGTPEFREVTRLIK